MGEFVLVTGATGNQGGAVARALLAAGEPVHALVRSPASPRALALEAAGATLVAGDLEEPASLLRALEGARGVFSVQTPDLADLSGDAEARHARHLAAAVDASGVHQIVHTSVSGAGRGPVDEARWGAFTAHYWRTKIEAEQRMRDAVARRWTILRPALFFDNFVRPSFYFSDPRRPDHLFVALGLDVAQAWVALTDIGAAAAAAFADPGRFDRVVLELAGDVRTIREVDSAVAEAIGVRTTVPGSPQEARDEGIPADLALYQDYVTAYPYPARPESARALGLSTTTLDEWIGRTFRGRAGRLAPVPDAT